jgi:ABC-2 type transport system ATP-binding protein
MTVKQLIQYVSAFHSNWNTELEKRYIKDFDVNLSDRVGPLTPGERQKLSILLAIGYEPDFLILDEPASALDPIARAQFLGVLIDIIQQKQKTILISSHILSDVEKIIDHVIIMKKGNILQDKSFDDLRDQYMRIKLTGLGDELPGSLPFENIVSSKRNNRQAVLVLENPDMDTIRNRAELLNCRIDIAPMPLEEIYRINMEPQERE